MIRARPAPSAVVEAVSRVRAWLAVAAIKQAERLEIAKVADVHERTLRFAIEKPEWNPRVDTLIRLEAAVPPDWQAPKRRKAA